jgi:ADP-ribose pyrophosphatase
VEPAQHFRFCPRCGQAQPHPKPAKPFRCSACHFLYYFNPAAAVAALVLRPDGCALFIHRAKEPAAGKLAMPGGFVDPGESAESALSREVREETGLELAQTEFLCSQPNLYEYQGVTYPVVDLFFLAQTVNATQAQALDAVAGITWLDPHGVDPGELAFPSMQKALAYFQKKP